MPTNRHEADPQISPVEVGAVDSDGAAVSDSPPGADTQEGEAAVEAMTSLGRLLTHEEQERRHEIIRTFRERTPQEIREIRRRQLGQAATRRARRQSDAS